ncbi:MAG: U32 family peptidase, partial [Oscillospiraceae bacterium]|nr:U32 family peptidase [Oscillospiraceae bacterium]
MRSGANAIYLGYKKFSARQNAENFDKELLKEVVSYCHRFSVSVYLALNTTVFDDELEDVAETIKTASQVGIDALIIQDMGVFSVAKKVCPTMPLHASTQRSVQSSEGVKRV